MHRQLKFWAIYLRLHCFWHVTESVARVTIPIQSYALMKRREILKYFIFYLRIASFQRQYRLRYWGTLEPNISYWFFFHSKCPITIVLIFTAYYLLKDRVYVIKIKSELWGPIPGKCELAGSIPPNGNVSWMWIISGSYECYKWEAILGTTFN